MIGPKTGAAYTPTPGASSYDRPETGEPYRCATQNEDNDGRSQIGGSVIALNEEV